MQAGLRALQLDLDVVKRPGVLDQLRNLDPDEVIRLVGGGLGVRARGLGV